MRVLHVTTTGRIGGAERVIADMARRAQPEMEIEVCTLRDPSELREALSGTGVRRHDLGLRTPAGMPVALSRLVALIRRRNFDVVHGHLLHGAALALSAATICRRPRVLTRHYAMHVHWYGTPSDRVLHKVGHSLADRVIAISHAVRDAAIRDGVAPELIDVIPNGVDAERIHLAGVQPEARITNRLRVVTVGSLHRRKDHATLLRAIADVCRGGVNAEVILVGEGPERQHLRELASDLGILDRVSFRGHVPDPYPILASCDVYAQSSVEEGFGIAVLEAMALGRAVVATTAGGLSEIIVDRMTGLLVESGSPERFGAALRQLAEDTSLRERLGIAARTDVVDRYSAAAMASSHESTYRRLLADGS